MIDFISSNEPFNGFSANISVNLDLNAGVSSFLPQSPDGFIAATIANA